MGARWTGLALAMIFAAAQVFGSDGDGPRAVENPYFTKMPGYRTVEDRNKAFDAFGFRIDVTLQRPWMDMNTGKLNQSTLISIVQRAP